jgi:hypothetical protein
MSPDRRAECPALTARRHPLGALEDVTRYSTCAILRSNAEVADSHLANSHRARQVTLRLPAGLDSAAAFRRAYATARALAPPGLA